MKELFEYILSNYLTEKEKLFRSNQLADYIRGKPYGVITKEAHIDTNIYIIEGFPGKGNWAGIPHIDIIDREITNTPTKGYYIVYLFKGNMTGIYLSLNQGWTYFKKTFTRNNPKAKIKQVTNAFRYKLKSPLVDFSFDEIDLKSPTRLGKGYESGHICGKFYPSHDLPDNQILINDLRNLIGVYRELKGILGLKSYEDIVKEILEYDYSPLNMDDIEDKQYQSKVIVSKPTNTPETPQKKPKETTRNNIKTFPRNPGKAKEALIEAKYRCETDPSHLTFIAKKTDQNYVEAHHLIPMSVQKDFTYDLDVPGNIISLCPNCHRKYHYACLEDKEEMLNILYEKRKKRLERLGIDISLNELFKLY